jgi:hypothetical protein
MPRDYEAAVDDLLAAIRTYLQHHQDEPVTDDTIAAYLSETDIKEIYQDLRQYPTCRDPARHLSGDASTSPSVIQTMLWGRVHNQTTTETPRDNQSVISASPSLLTISLLQASYICCQDILAVR